ncbi:MAG: UPF0149 family protein [Ferrimicrobium sp.]
MVAEMLSETELDQLAEFLDDPESPDDRLTLTAFDGFAAGLAVAPELVVEDLWLELALGEDSGVPDELAALLVRHVAAVREAIQSSGEDFLPIFDADESDPDSEEVSPVEWCAGFLLATDLYPDAFSSLADDEEAVNLMLPIVVFGTEEGIEALESSDEDGFAESLLDSIQPSVLELGRFFSRKNAVG